MNLYKKTEFLLYNYKNTLVEIKNINLEIESLKLDYTGCSGISYEEKSAPTNKFNSAIENEVISKEKRIEQLEVIKKNKLIIVNKIDNALEILDARLLEIIKLRYFEKRSNRYIAEKLNLTEEWISKLKSDTINQLSDLINI
ncbi:MAG: hypothetical protein K0R54_5220 [Clostridiaceae bacterium]|jgi:RNA polymerase sigma factor (sigma-70 family)|nr:hypothetical protein [Clostridiaceae bacterium]